MHLLTDDRVQCGPSSVDIQGAMHPCSSQNAKEVLGREYAYVSARCFMCSSWRNILESTCHAIVSVECWIMRKLSLCEVRKEDKVLRMIRDSKGCYLLHIHLWHCCVHFASSTSRHSLSTLAADIRAEK